MTFYILIISLAMILLLLINKALNHGSKDCEFNMDIKINSFKISFKTKEKNAPPSSKK